MELANIEKILIKYENGTSSLQEETALRAYFSGGAVAPHLQEYEYLFHYFETVKEETFTKSIQLDSKKKKTSNLKWRSVAAFVAVLLSVFFVKKQHDAVVVKAQYAEVVKALDLLSANLKKGEQAVATLYTYENTINKILKQSK
jgi:hypothetical protein